MVDKIRNQITYAQRFVNRYEQRQREGEVDPIIVGDENKKRNQYEQISTMSYQLNVRAMLSASINGTGDCDVTRPLLLMGLGGKAFERTFYRNSEYMHQIIMRVTKRLVHTALLEDIGVSIDIMIKERKIDVLERRAHFRKD